MGGHRLSFQTVMSLYTPTELVIDSLSLANMTDLAMLCFQNGANMEAILYKLGQFNKAWF